MKESYYNLYAPCNTGVLCFNTYYDNYLVMNSQTYNLIQNGKYGEINMTTLKVLQENGFIIENDTDEYSNLVQEYHKTDTSGTFNLTLLPSLDCNVRCWYCFEKHITGSHLPSQQQDILFKYTQNILNRDDISIIHFSLFGGEPMLYFKEEVAPLLFKVKDYAKKIGKDIRVSIVTNATCITQDIIPMLAELNATFQISIDGYREKHNSIKKSPQFKEGTYDIVMKTIHDLTNAYDSRINLRINFDNHTFKHLHSVVNDIQDIDKKKIRIHLERVWQTTPSDNSTGIYLKEFINDMLRKNFRLSYLNFSRRTYSCFMDLKNNVVISYNGDVYNCTGRDFTDTHKEGLLTSDGDIEWEQEKLQKRAAIKTYDNPTCTRCKFLPQCWGLCKQKILEHPNKVEQMCPLKAMELSMDDYITYRFNNEYITRNIFGDDKPVSFI